MERCFDSQAGSVGNPPWPGPRFPKESRIANYCSIQPCLRHLATLTTPAGAATGSYRSSCPSCGSSSDFLKHMLEASLAFMSPTSTVLINRKAPNPSHSHRWREAPRGLDQCRASSPRFTTQSVGESLGKPHLNLFGAGCFLLGLRNLPSCENERRTGHGYDACASSPAARQRNEERHLGPRRFRRPSRNCRLPHHSPAQPARALLPSQNAH